MKGLRHSGLSCGQVMGSRSPGQELADLHEAVDIEIIEYLHYFLHFHLHMFYSLTLLK